MSKLRRARCPRCERELAVRVPRGGDGTRDVFPRHFGGDGLPCDGGRTTVELNEYVEARGFEGSNT